MSTDISPENEQYLQEAVARGTFHSRGQALNAAVELLKQREQLIRDVGAGIEQLERGECGVLDIEDIKARGRKRLADEGRLG
jgi:Arc/MetJ-type ribon-helix-helix transcriptional regulator